MNNHGNKPEEIGVTACDHGRYTGMISPSITRKSRVSSLVADSRSCCHPLPKLVENPLSRCGHTQIAGFGAFSKNGGTHTVPLRGAHVKNLNSHLKSLRNKRKERQKEQR